MNALEHLEQQVLQLSSEDLEKFRAWFLELDHQLWDKEIEADFQGWKAGSASSMKRERNSRRERLARFETTIPTEAVSMWQVAPANTNPSTCVNLPKTLREGMRSISVDRL